MLALHGDGDGEVDVGEQADRGPAVPGLPADDLPGVQAGGLLAELVIFSAARLLDAYLAEVVTLPELDRKRQDLDRRHAALTAQQRQLDAAARQKLELGAVADGIEAFCQAVRAGLATATFEQRRLLAELLIDRVVVTDSDVEIRYVLPTSPDGPHRLLQLCAISMV